MAKVVEVGYEVYTHEDDGYTTVSNRGIFFNQGEFKLVFLKTPEQFYTIVNKCDGTVACVICFYLEDWEVVRLNLLFRMPCNMNPNPTFNHSDHDGDFLAVKNTNNSADIYINIHSDDDANTIPAMSFDLTRHEVETLNNYLHSN